MSDERPIALRIAEDTYISERGGVTHDLGRAMLFATVEELQKFVVESGWWTAAECRRNPSANDLQVALFLQKRDKQGSR